MDNYEKILYEIKNGIKDEWTNLEKIRYVYITVGKLIKKDTDFFLSLKNKLGELNLSKEDLYNIYNDDKTIDSDNWNKVICKSAAIILKRIYDDLNIKSDIIETIDFDDALDFEIHHYFLCVNDGVNNYFLTLVADLANIQNGLMTEHFGTNIEYYRDDINGEPKQVYSGPEIEHRVIPLDELKEIDDKIGYTTIFSDIEDTRYTNYLFEQISAKMAKNRWYYDSIAEHTYFYKKYFIDNPFLTINNENRQKYNDLIKDICSDIEEKILGVEIYTSNFNFDNWYNMMLDYPNLTDDNKKLLRIAQDFNNCINEAYNNYEKNNGLVGKDLIKFKKQFERKSHKLAEFFVNKKILPPNQFEYATNDYIQKKLELMFLDFFEANKGSITDYNKLDYSEQIDIIKKIFLPMVFKDLGRENCKVDKMDYDENYPAILNRIYVRALKNKEDNTYSLSLVLRGNEDTRYFVYDLKKNIFSEKSNIEIIDFLQYNVVCKSNNYKQGNNDLKIENIEKYL